ncbi:MAG TPA: DUF72 domain-containing protein [Rhizomicrobium sp.]
MSIIGPAGWTIPTPYKTQFPDEGTHLARYAARLNGVEINSSFYRRHKRATYERWAAAVPANFRFSVKLPRAITQHHRLKDYGNLLEQFREEASGLGNELGVVLAQLPPSLAFDAEVAKTFFNDLASIGLSVVCEPRHASWFTPSVADFLKRLCVTRVAADPPRASEDGKPGGDTHLAYFRMHGSPQIYHSNYSKNTLKTLALELRKGDWCIFDNTAAHHALGNALALSDLISVL